MKTKYHVLSSIPLGIGYYAMSKDPVNTLLAMGAAVLIDVDHILDYVLTQKRIDPIPKMVQAFDWLIYVKKNYLFLHSWEIVIALAVFQWISPHPSVMAILSGYGLHLLIDQIYNSYCLGKFNLKPLFYFLCYRMRFNFDVLPLRQHANLIDINEKIYA